MIRRNATKRGPENVKERRGNARLSAVVVSSNAAAPAGGSSDNDSQASSLDQQDEVESNASVEVTQVADEKGLDDVIDNLGDKRAFIRIQALKQLSHALTHVHHLGPSRQALFDRQETLNTNLLNCVKKGTSEEVIAACRAAALCMISMGEQGEPMFRHFSASLQAYAKDPQKNVTSRAQVIGLLGMLCFVGCPSEDETMQIMALLRHIFTKTKSTKAQDNSELIAQSLESWGLLATTLPHKLLASATFQRIMGELVGLLEDESVDVRTEAGEDIALLYSARLEHLVQLQDAEDEANHKSKDKKPQQAANGHNDEDDNEHEEQEDEEEEVDGKDYVFDRDHLIDLLHELSTEGGRHRARKDRLRQKSTFRDILKTVEAGEKPEESLTIGKDRHEFSGWDSLRRLESLREYLGTGFQLHFYENPLLADIFGVDITPLEEVSDLDVRRMRRDNMAMAKAKARSQYEHNTKQRRRKQAATLSED